MEKGGYTYIMANHQKRLYTGVTAQLAIRVTLHKKKTDPNSFTARYNINKLVYYESFESINEAIARESQIKNLHRVDKVQLIVGLNPDWRDLSANWGRPAPPFREQELATPTTFL